MTKETLKEIGKLSFDIAKIDFVILVKPANYNHSIIHK